MSNYSATWPTHHPNSTGWTAYWYRTMSWPPDPARPGRLFGDGRGVDRGRSPPPACSTLTMVHPSCRRRIAGEVARQYHIVRRHNYSSGCRHWLMMGRGSRGSSLLFATRDGALTPIVGYFREVTPTFNDILVFIKPHSHIHRCNSSTVPFSPERGVGGVLVRRCNQHGTRISFCKSDIEVCAFWKVKSPVDSFGVIINQFISINLFRHTQTLFTEQCNQTKHSYYVWRVVPKEPNAPLICLRKEYWLYYEKLASQISLIDFAQIYA